MRLPRESQRWDGSPGSPGRSHHQEGSLARPGLRCRVGGGKNKGWWLRSAKCWEVSASAAPHMQAGGLCEGPSLWAPCWLIQWAWATLGHGGWVPFPPRVLPGWERILRLTQRSLSTSSQIPFLLPGPPSVSLSCFSRELVWYCLSPGM